MRFEKISNNQIKCFIDKEDLTDRGIVISDLAYGSDNAKTLFEEVVRKAFVEVGFTNDEHPIMIEAIPLSTGSLIILLTKVQDPEELDPRFSKFSLENDTSFLEEEAIDGPLPLEDSVIGSNVSLEKEPSSFIPLPEILKSEEKEKNSSQKNQVSSQGNHTKIYSFPNLKSICELAEKIGPIYTGYSSVYKDKSRGLYYLVLEREASDKENFGKITNFLSEYSTPLKGNYATLSYVVEHFEPIIKADALTILSVL